MLRRLAISNSSAAPAPSTPATPPTAPPLRKHFTTTTAQARGAGPDARGGRPCSFSGGHPREGIAVAQGLYDIHGSGMGAAPHRDGVNTGGHMNIPSAGISDVERIEMQYPFLYFTRSHNPDGRGFGPDARGLG